MHIDDLFPNSTDKLVAEIGPLLQSFLLTKRQKKVIKMLAERALAHTQCVAPITISKAEITSDERPTIYAVAVTRGGNTIYDGHTPDEGQADYRVAMWKHVLLGHPAPDITKYKI